MVFSSIVPGETSGRKKTKIAHSAVLRYLRPLTIFTTGVRHLSDPESSKTCSPDPDIDHIHHQGVFKRFGCFALAGIDRDRHTCDPPWPILGDLVDRRKADGIGRCVHL